MKKVLCVAAFLVFLYQFSIAQETKYIDRQKLIWYGHFVTLKFNERWYWQTEVQERHFVNPTAQHQIFLRSQLHRYLGNSGWQVSASMWCFYKARNPLLLPKN